MKIRNTTRQTILASRTELADTVFSRLQGLLGRNSLPEQHALIITQCRSIHMFFMRFAIDAVFVDRQHKVVGLVENLKPFQMSPYFFRASYVIELPVGTIRETRTSLHDTIEWVGEG